MDVSMTDPPPGIFFEVTFHIVVSDKLTEKIAAEARDLLLANGAVEAPAKPATVSSRITIDLEEVTHIIAANTDFPGYADAENLMIPVVRPEWVRHSVLKKRIAHVRPFTPDPRFFFSDVAATIADLPLGDKEAICGGVIAMGGQYSTHLTKFTTHIVALNMENEKCKQAIEKKLRVKIVLPHWFDDCLKLGRRIDEAPYQLPNPEIETVDASAPLPMPTVDLSYMHAREGGLMEKDPPKPPREGYNIFAKKRVMLGKDLNINERLRNVLAGIVVQTSGVLTDNVDDADVYVGMYREGGDYVKASRRSAYVGNLTWLYWMFAHGEWTHPNNRLLHYPIVRGGIPEMWDKVITVSNYGGDARLYLESLIEACGAKFTKSMKTDNTHLISARAHSEKCVAAKEWNIHMVNHLWLEDTYAKWKVMTVTNPRYTHFPRRTNLMEVVGQTRIDADAVRQFYGFDDIDMETASSTGEAEDATTAVSGNGTARPITAHPTNGKAPETTPAPRKRKAPADEESPAPPSTGRKAKERAAARLHDTIMPDVAQYQKELKRKGGIMGSGRSRAGSVDSIGAKSKRSKSAESGDEKVAKKAKKRPPKPTIFLLITGYNGWLEQAQKEEADKKVLAEFGIKCVDDPAQCTHLAAPGLKRTEKFIRALARAPIVVSTDWIEACVREERLVDANDYVLNDPEGEKRLSVELASSLARARENKGKLLEGQTVYCTSGVPGGFDVCKRIVDANGGVCVLFKTAKRPANAPDSERIVLLSSDSANCKRWWPKFEGMAKRMRREWSIYKSDWLLETAMNQQVAWSKKYNVA
ncbi:BRCT domain-containing protein [Sphaerosporella brunnea]|uniref:BRCT domain-containing protein n=1 Tax=Sphaerosporella brunnea TaxID=1250544 RepID=A0A5J5EZV1_9PEZI|nr:BRCT domain-containing protein [Sphaerosporella brunnea]